MRACIDIIQHKHLRLEQIQIVDLVLQPLLQLDNGPLDLGIGRQLLLVLNEHRPLPAAQHVEIHALHLREVIDQVPPVVFDGVAEKCNILGLAVFDVCGLDLWELVVVQE